MKLFSKDVDLVKRLLNLILVVWFLGAIIFSYTSLVELVIEKNNYTYDEYEMLYCKNDDIHIDNCDIRFNQHKQSQKRDKYYNLKTFVNSIGNVVIVGAFMFVLNRESYEKQAK